MISEYTISGDYERKVTSRGEQAIGNPATGRESALKREESFLLKWAGDAKWSGYEKRADYEKWVNKKNKTNY